MQNITNFFNQFNVLLYHYNHALLQPITSTAPTHQSDYPPIHLGCSRPWGWWVLIFIFSLLLMWSIFCLKILWQCLLRDIVLICFFERERDNVCVCLWTNWPNDFDTLVWVYSTYNNIMPSHFLAMFSVFFSKVNSCKHYVHIEAQDSVSD
jgi:hypothetical protein